MKAEKKIPLAVKYWQRDFLIYKEVEGRESIWLM